MANNSHDNSHDTHATTGNSGGWSSRRIAITAVFVAIGMALSFAELPIFPAAPYLKYDPSGIACLVAGLAFGPVTGIIVSALMWLPHAFTNPYGTIMAILVAEAHVIPAALIYRRNQTRTGAIVGIVVGAVVAIVAAIVGNIIITPLYTPTTMADVVGLIVPVLLPFNALKAALNSVVTVLVYKSISQIVGQ